MRTVINPLVIHISNYLKNKELLVGNSRKGVVLARQPVGPERGVYQSRGKLISSFDLAAEGFLVLRRAFFSEAGTLRAYQLRDKRNTQDDPLDEKVAQLLENLPGGARCVKARGPLITPDMVLIHDASCRQVGREALASDLSRVVAIEVKKLERTSGGGIARASGMDYNTTPPCRRVRVYDRQGQPLSIRGFYLFVCQEPVEGSSRRYRISAMALCDGSLLNEDFDYYLSIVGERTKEVGLGSYGDGANRSRPMLIFANPLGAEQLDHQATLIHSDADLGGNFRQLRLVGVVRRTVPGGGTRTFYCYRFRGDVPRDHHDFDLLDPFPSPERSTTTQARGRFRLDL